MKKSYFLVVMIVVLVALMSGTAFATRYDSGYQTFSTSPHGQYSTATTKCAACHAVHNPGGLSGLAGSAKDTEAERDAALGTSEALLRGDIANACSYCHVSATFGIKTVYAEDTANYTTADGRAHSNTANTFSDTSVRCTDCHQVHGASTAMASTADLYMYSKILKAQPLYDADAPAFAANADPDTADQSNITRWCTGCHCYYEAGFDSNSHVMTDTISAYGNSHASNSGDQVAWAASTDCRSCHQAGVTDQLAAVNGANNYPHFTGGYRFLYQANSSAVATADAAVPGAGNAANDGTCLICHNNGTSGAGTTF